MTELQLLFVCLFVFLRTGDLLEAGTAIVDGYNSYFSFSRGRSGYSGPLQSLDDQKINKIMQTAPCSSF